MAGKEKKDFSSFGKQDFKAFKPTDNPTERASTTKKAPASGKRSNSDYIRLYVGEYKEYLTKIAALESLNTGEQVSVSKYVLKLIEADKKAREKEL